MILYHGLNAEIATIDFLKSKVGKDFGVGFLWPYRQRRYRIPDAPC